MAIETVATATKAKSTSVFLVGNPNTGKTTLFNALTGLRHRVGNYPGVTVETKTGQCEYERVTLRITDLPGTYSLIPRSPDEMLVVDLLLGHRAEISRPDVVVCILDASNLDRNLYLATQILELGIPTVLALNMTDVAEAQGIRIDFSQLCESLGVPVVPIQANAKRGLEELKRAILNMVGGEPPSKRPVFPDVFRQQVSDLKDWLSERNGQAAETYLVQRALIDAEGYTQTVLTDTYGPDFTRKLSQARQHLREAGVAVPALEAQIRYAWISERTAGLVVRPSRRKVTRSDRIDRILLHRFWGLLTFLVVMTLIFQSIYSMATYLMDPIVAGFDMLGESVSVLLPEGALRGLIVHGIIAGVGGVLVFLPQIVILFGFLALLEDCGYMARAAFLMDKLMARCGLSGKSFIPMLSSFACAIPGVMAARVIEDRRDRLTTILVAPLMSCSARLPVYVLLIGGFIPAQMILGFLNLQGLVLLSMYSIGLIVAPLIALVLKRTVFRGEAPVFLMELPSYKMPSLSTVLHRMYDRGLAFVKRAGTIILATAVVVWGLQYYPRPNSITAEFAPRLAELEIQKQKPGADLETVEKRIRKLENAKASAYQQQSFLGRMGKTIEPVIRPLGWDWKIGMAAIASFPAREVVIAAMGTIYSVGSDIDVADDDSRSRLEAAMKSATWPDGRPVFTVPVALSLMVFFVLCCQCAATLAVIKRETNSWRWPIFTFVYMTSLAYLGAFAVYQIGSRLGG